jgi:predicted Zn-dependent peptidase
MIRTSCSPKSYAEIRKIMEKETKNALDGKIDAKLVKNCKNTQKYGLITAQERTNVQAERGFNYERLHMAHLIDRVTECVERVTPKQMVDAANKYFAEDKQYWTVMKPVK